MSKPKQNLPPYERYIVQWVTEFDDDNHCIKVLGYCVRDRDSFNWKTVFEHEDEVVCRKVCEILNEED